MKASPKTRRQSALSFFLFFEAWWELLRAMVWVRVPSGRARRLQDALRVPTGSDFIYSRPEERETWRAAAVAVDRASRYHLRPMRCLNRSLALLWMLRRRGIPTALQLGCRRQGPALAFHAWIVDGEVRPLDESLEHGSFVPLRWPNP